MSIAPPPPSRRSLLDDMVRKPVEVSATPAPKKSRRGMVKVVASAAVLLAAGVMVLRSVTAPTPGSESKTRVAVDSASGEVFETLRIRDGDAFPWENPRTGERTLYPAEKCFWAAGGRAKLEPTYVFVKAYAGDRTPTTCPDCGREVRQHNPMPPDELMLEALKESKGR